MQKKTLAGLLALSLPLTIFATDALAANRDVHEIDTQKTYVYKQFINNESQFMDLIDKLEDNPSNYLFEMNGYGYNYAALYEKYRATNNLESALEQTPKEQLPGEVEGELKVESVSAINATTIKVVFNQEVEELAKADVVVTNVKTADKQYVKEVKLAEDKKSAEVTFYDALETKNTYKVVVGDAEAEFDFIIGDVAQIEAKAVQVVKAGEIDLAKLDFKVLDAAGLDITETTEVGFEATVTVTPDNKIANLADGQTAFVYVVYTQTDGTKLKSDRITVKAEAPKAAEITDFTVDKNTEDATVFDKKDYKQNLNVQKGDEEKKVIVAAKDQFGDAIAVTPKFESLDKTVALVDQSNGHITPLKEGLAPVRITVGEVTKTIELNVVADAKATAIELDKAEISISNQVTTPEKVKVTVKDQYDNVFKINDNVTVKVLSGKDLVEVKGLNNDGKIPLANGEKSLEIAVKDKTKSGNAVIEIAFSDTIKTTLAVNVTEAGIIDNYVVEGFKAELDKNGDASDAKKLPEKMTLTVFPVDADGVKTGDAVDVAKYAIKNEDGKYFSNTKESVTWATEENLIEVTTPIAAADLKEDETYTLIAKVGTIEVFQDTFKVVDTTEKPVIEQIGSKIEKTDLALTIGDFDNILEAKTGDKTESITKISFKSDNSNVIKTGNITTTPTNNIIGFGSATLVIDSVEVTEGQPIELSDTRVVLTVNPETLGATEKDSKVTYDAVYSDNTEIQAWCIKVEVTGADLKESDIKYIASVQKDGTFKKLTPDTDSVLWLVVTERNEDSSATKGKVTREASTQNYIVQDKDDKWYTFNFKFDPSKVVFPE